MKNAFLWNIKTSSYLTGDTLLLYYKAQPVIAVNDSRLSRRELKRMLCSVMLCRAALVRTHVSEERIAYIIRATRVSELETTLVFAACFRY
jgi:hypothetical protein